MSSASGIRAGQAYVELLADDSTLQAGLASAQKRLADWGGQIRHVGLAVAGAGTGLLAPLIASAKLFASSGDALAKLSVRTGLSVELLSQLKYAAGLAGTSLEDLETASKRLSVTIVEAVNGSKGAIDTLGGVSLVKRLAPLTQDQRFLAVAKAIGLIADPARRAAAAVAVFGRSGTELLPLIAQLDDLRAEAQRLGVTMSTDQAERAHHLQEAWERAEGALARVTKGVSSALAPALTSMAEAAVPVLVALKQWIAQHQDLVLRIAETGAALVTTGSVIIAFSGLVTTAAWVCRAFAIATATATAAMGGLRSALALGTAAWSAFRLEALTANAALRLASTISATMSNGMGAARIGVLGLALAFGRLRLIALATLTGLPAVVGGVRTAVGSAIAVVSGLATRPRSPGSPSLADRGRATVDAGAQLVGGAAASAGAALRSTLTTLISLPARIATAFVGMASRSAGALQTIRTALVGVRLVGSLMTSLLVSAAGRVAVAIPAALVSAWSAATTGAMTGVGAVARVLATLPSVAVGVGRAVVVGLGSAISALPTLLYGAIGLATAAIQAVPGLIAGAFSGLRVALAALPGLISAAFTLLPGLVSLALNPVVLLGAAIFGLGIYLAQTTGNGTQALSALGRAFDEVKDDAVTAFGAISEALSAGDIRGAVQVLWAFIQLEWTRGVAAVENLMQAFAAGVAKAFLHVGFGINTAFWTVVYGIGNAIDSVVAGILKAFSSVIGTIATKVATLLELVHAVDKGTSDQISGLSKGFNAGVDQQKGKRGAERDQKLSEFKALWDEKIADVNQRMASGMQARDADISAKRAALDKAIADAKQARIATKPPADQNPADQPGAASPTGADLNALSQELAARLNTVQLKVDTVGTFNPAALGEMGVSGTAAERGLQAQEKTSRFTERIMNVVENGGSAVFE